MCKRCAFQAPRHDALENLMAEGTARDVVSFLFNSQQLLDGSFPRNSLLNGQVAPDSFGTQLDEASYPILMADQLGMADSDLYQNHIKPAANFVISHGPAFGVERWEEQNGYSPSTIAAEVAPDRGECLRLIMEKPRSVSQALAYLLLG